MAVFPASGYVSMALEACRLLTADRQVQLLELHDLAITRAITFDDSDDSGVEILATLTAIEYEYENPDGSVTGSFAVYSAPNTDASLIGNSLERVASGQVKIWLGPADRAALTAGNAAIDDDDYNMSEIDNERLYAAFAKLNYGYTRSFRGLSSIKRRLNRASALVDIYVYSDDESTFYLLHPSILDVAIQSAMLAYSSPGDGRLWALHVPINIGSIRLNPVVATSVPLSGSRIPIVTVLGEDAEAFSANISVFSEDGQQGMVQVEDLILRPFAPATAAEDRWMYSYTKLDVAAPDASPPVHSEPISPGTELASDKVAEALPWLAGMAK